MATTRSRIASIVVLGALTLSACGDDGESTDVSATTVGDTSAVADTTSPAPTATVAPDTSVADSVEEGIFTPYVITVSGLFLVDAAGMSLYTFTNDPADSTVSTCYEGCAGAWPPVVLGSVEELELEGGLAIEDFNWVFRDDGGIQVTYLGAPLYYYAGDSAPGDQNGEGVGGVWFLATAIVGG